MDWLTLLITGDRRSRSSSRFMDYKLPGRISVFQLNSARGLFSEVFDLFDVHVRNEEGKLRKKKKESKRNRLGIIHGNKSSLK